MGKYISFMLIGNFAYASAEKFVALAKEEAEKAQKGIQHTAEQYWDLQAKKIQAQVVPPQMFTVNLKDDKSVQIPLAVALDKSVSPVLAAAVKAAEKDGESSITLPLTYDEFKFLPKLLTTMYKANKAMQNENNEFIRRGSIYKSLKNMWLADSNTVQEGLAALRAAHFILANEDIIMVLSNNFSNLFFKNPQAIAWLAKQDVPVVILQQIDRQYFLRHGESLDKQLGLKMKLPISSTDYKNYRDYSPEELKEFFNLPANFDPRATIGDPSFWSRIIRSTNTLAQKLEILRWLARNDANFNEPSAGTALAAVLPLVMPNELRARLKDEQGPLAEFLLNHGAKVNTDPQLPRAVVAQYMSGAIDEKLVNLVFRKGLDLRIFLSSGMTPEEKQNLAEILSWPVLLNPERGERRAVLRLIERQSGFPIPNPKHVNQELIRLRNLQTVTRPLFSPTELKTMHDNFIEYQEYKDSLKKGRYG